MIQGEKQGFALKWSPLFGRVGTKADFCGFYIRRESDPGLRQHVKIQLNPSEEWLQSTSMKRDP